MNDVKTCATCGEEFLPGRSAKGRFCSKACALASFQGRKIKKEEAPEILDGALDEFMAQPEITHLRAGIRIAIKTAYERVHGRK